MVCSRNTSAVNSTAVTRGAAFAVDVAWWPSIPLLVRAIEVEKVVVDRDDKLNYL